MLKLKQWRAQNRLSLEDAGKLVGVSGVQWHRYETDKRRVPYDKVTKVEGLTGISRHELRPDLSRIFISNEPASNGEVA